MEQSVLTLSGGSTVAFGLPLDDFAAGDCASRMELQRLTLAHFFGPGVLKAHGAIED